MRHMDNELRTMNILLPNPGQCAVCAVLHTKEEPHDKDSLFYILTFHNAHGRSPTWEDAMAHCTPELKALWTEALRRLQDE